MHGMQQVDGIERSVCEVSDDGNGSYSLQYCCTVAGKYTLRVFLDDKPIVGSPFAIVVVAANAQAHSSRFSLPAGMRLQAGIETELLLHTFDEFGNGSTSGVSTIEVALHSISSQAQQEAVVVHATTEEHAGGAYISRFAPTKSGRYTLKVLLNGVEVAGSPAVATIEPAETSAAHCLLKGKGLQQAKAGVESGFEIYACDRFGSRRENGGDAFDVQLNGVAKVAAKLTDRGDGVYDAVYTAFRSGTYALSVLLHGRHAAGSPYQLVVAPAATHGACSSIVGGAVQSVLRAGSSISFAVQAMDQFGNKRTQGGDKLLVQFSKGGTSIKSTVKDLGDGRYEVALVGTVSIVCAMQLLLENTPIMGSPFQLAVEAGETDAAQCTIRNESVLQSAVAGEVISVVLEARDRFGNRRTEGGDSVHLRASECGSESSVAGECFDQLDGTYRCDWVCTVSGNWSVSFKVPPALPPSGRAPPRSPS
jgi:hypothetical protein